ncbi:hypothetical protein GCM10007385_46530 [Tateyamaria omphalii]|nr:hypothetical protein GCM10007385_46530 [Tateyamaria omphalii]
MRDFLSHQVYLWGYCGHAAPRWARRAFAKTEAHRAWFLGFHGFFEQDGASYGLARPYPSIREG